MVLFILWAGLGTAGIQGVCVGREWERERGIAWFVFVVERCVC